MVEAMTGRTETGRTAGPASGRGDWTEAMAAEAMTGTAMEARGPLPSPAPEGGTDGDAPEGAPVVSILVIAYNVREMTLDCLASIARETRLPHEVILLDNASADGTVAAVEAAFPAAAHPWLRLIASDTNHGFAEGNNIAARQARGRYLLLLNPDTVVLDGAIDRIVAFAERTPAAGIWGGRTIFADGRLNPPSVFGDLTLWSLFCRASGLSLIFPDSPLFESEHYGGWQRDSEREVDAVQGSFFLIRRDLWEALEGFDPTFVMYSEEADLCRRARARGARPRMTPEATIIHHHGASTKRRADREILTFTAQATLIRRHFPAWQRPLALFLLRLWPFTRMVSGRGLARLLGRPELAEAAERWGEVWRARRRWSRGYPPRPRSGAV